MMYIMNLHVEDGVVQEESISSKLAGITTAKQTTPD